MLKANRLACSLLALGALQLCGCDGPRVRLPLREAREPPALEPDAGGALCDDSAACTDPERPLCDSSGTCVQCIEDGDCPQGECERATCREGEEEQE